MDEIKIEDRPREKLINNGASTLSEIELLAIMLGSGNKNESVMELAERLINDYGIERLFKMNYNELKNISGVKMAKASKLMATFEIARRILSSNINDIRLNKACDVFRYVRGMYSFLDKEMLTVILVDSKLCVIDKKCYSDNKYDCVDFHLKDIIKYAIDKDCYGIFVVHNHPGGSLYPSESDIKSTKMLINMCNMINIHFFDHLIISNDKYYSFSETSNIFR